MSTDLAGKLVIALALGVGVTAAYYGATRWTSSNPASLESAPVLEPVTAAVVATSLPVKKVEKLEIDLEQRRVLVPGEGWLSAQAFWEIYYLSPQKLPGDIDFAVLREFEALTAAERAQAESLANPQAQVADVEEPVFDDPISADDPVPAE